MKVEIEFIEKDEIIVAICPGVEAARMVAKWYQQDDPIVGVDTETAGIPREDIILELKPAPFIKGPDPTASDYGILREPKFPPGYAKRSKHERRTH